MNKIIAIMLFIGVLPMPMDYYDILRFAVSAVALLNIFKEKYIYIPILIIFNPIIPVYLYDKAIWAIIDIVAGMVFFSDNNERIKMETFSLHFDDNEDSNQFSNNGFGLNIQFSSDDYINYLVNLRSK